MEDKLKNILSALLMVDIKMIDNNSSAKTIEEWDSFKQMNIIVAIEEEFDVQFDEDDTILLNSYKLLLKSLNDKFHK